MTTLRSCRVDRTRPANARPRRPWPSAAFAQGPRRPRVRRHLLAEGLHSAHQALSRSLRLLHVRPGAGARRRALHEPRRGDGRRPGGSRRRLHRGALHARRASGAALRRRRPWLAARGYRSTVDYVADAAQMVLEEHRPLAPRERRRALSTTNSPNCASVSASQGMMLEVLADVPAHRLAPDKAPQRRLDTLRFAGRAQDPLHDRAARGHRRDVARTGWPPSGDRRVARGVRPRPRGHRPELPAQARTAMAHAPRARATRSSTGRSPRRARPARRHPPPGPAEPE